MKVLRARYLLAMGLPSTLAACENEPAHQPEPVATATASASPPVTATATATASAVPTTPVATPTVTVTAVVQPPPPPVARGLSNVPSFSAEYPHPNGRGCSTAMAHCYLLSDLQKQASAGVACPAHEDVPQGCMGGAICNDPGARTTGDLLAGVSRAQTAEKHHSACCYTVPDLCCAACGRTLRDGEHVIVTEHATRSDWARNGITTTVDREAGARFAAIAAAEHASIASFARASLDLLALAAPADLVRDTHAAALDEIEHARIAYTLASRLSGVVIGPGALPLIATAAPSYASFAVSTFLDACVGETIGAVQLRDLAARERDADIASTLEHMASDEDRHAELAFRTLAWVVRTGGREASLAVRAAANGLDAKLRAQAVVKHVVLPCTFALLDTH